MPGCDDESSSLPPLTGYCCTLFPMRVGKCSVFVAPYGREVVGVRISQCCAPLRALALGYDCRALRALPLRGLTKAPLSNFKNIIPFLLLRKLENRDINSILLGDNGFMKTLCSP